MSALKVGFIGLGNMGLLMAKALIKNGVRLTVFDVRKEPCQEMEPLGASVAGSSRQVAEASDVIISIVRDEAQTDEVVFGKEGIFKGIHPGSYFVISSTVSPACCRRLDARLQEKGAQVVDAAVSTESRNFTPGQESAVFTLMVGGEKTAYETCQPVFKALTHNVFYLGPAGSGAAAKLVNNLAMYGNMMVARECLNLGLRAGLDFRQLVEAMRVSTGYSRGMMNAVRILHQTRPAAPKSGQPKMSLEEKDNQAAMQLADEVGALAPLSRFMFDLDIDKIYESLARQRERLNPSNNNK